MKYAVLFLLFFFSLLSFAQDIPEINVDLSKNSLFDIKTKWAFVKGDFVSPDKIISDIESGNRGRIEFKSFLDSQFDMIDSIGTLALKVNISGKENGVGLKLPPFFGGYRLFINTKEIASFGEVGKDLSTKTNRNTVFFTPEIEAFYIVIHEGALESEWGINSQDIVIGSTDKISKLREKGVVFDIFVAGSLLIIAIYQIILFVFRKKDKTSFIFSVFCFIFSVRTLFFGEALIFKFFNISYSTIMPISLSIVALATITTAAYVASLFPHETNNKINNICYGVSFAYIISAIFLPGDIAFKLLGYYHVFAFLSIIYFCSEYVFAIRKRRDAAILSLAGIVIFFLCVINDILNSHGFIRSGQIASYGLVVFVATQAAVISIKISKAYARIEELSANLIHTNERLAKIDKTKTDFLHLISHELRTPLNGIIGMTSMIEDESASDEYRESIDIIKTSAEKLRHFSETALLITQMKTNAFDMEFLPNPIHDIIKESVDKVIDKITAKSITVLREVEESLLKIDAPLIEKVVEDIIDNAIKHSPKGAEISIKGKKDERNYIITIEDNGEGFSQNLLHSIFELFSSQDIAHHHEGLGLSLAGARLIMDAHGGTIKIENKQESRGARVSLIF